MKPFDMNTTSDAFREAVEQIKKAESCKPYLKKSKRGNYICPFCGSGTGPNGSGALAYDAKTNTCFCYAGCADPGQKAKPYSVIDLFMQETGAEFSEAVRILAEKNGVSLPEKPKKADFSPERKKTGETTERKTETPKKRNFDAYLKACAARLNDPRAVAYLNGRGISVETARLYGLGFDQEADPANAPGAAPGEPRPFPVPRIITPFSNGSGYVGRRIDGNPDHKAPVARGSAADITGADMLDGSSPVFVVEGIFDALSIMEAEPTAAAISLNSANFSGELVKRLEANRPTMANGRPVPFILSLDNDEAGQKANLQLSAELDRLQIPHIVASIAGEYKDANEALTEGGKDELRQTIRAAMALSFAAPIPKRKEEKTEAQEEPAPDTVPEEAAAPKTPDEIFEEFLDEIHGRSYEPVRTNISDIDRMLHGGFLRRTLVTLGAAPGAGKTALAQWLFEGMAAAGTDVLYINLEMDRAQLLARSISRIAWKKSDKKQKGGFSSLDVMRAYDWTPSQQAAFTEAIDEYKKTTLPHFMYNPDGVTNHIDSIIEACQQETNRLTAAGRPAPIICIDYLQIIDTDERETAEGVKNAMFRLKDFARNNNTVVFLIIANNRASNKAGVADMESGRDTSAIEYSGDLMLGLVYTAIEDGRTYTWTERDEAGRIVKDKNGTPVQRSKKYDLETIRFLRRQAEDRREDPPAVCNEISLKVLKNRFGASERRANFIFDGEHSTFRLIEREDRKDDDRGSWQQGSFDDITASF